MPRIQVVPEHLEELSVQMSQIASALRDLEAGLGRALSGLDWEARQQVNVEARVHAARTHAQRLAADAERLARYLTERAAAFRQADAEGAQRLGDTVRSYTPPVPVPVPTPLPNSQAVSSTLDLGKLLAPIQDLSKHVEWLTVIPLLTLVKQMRIDAQGVAHIFGPQWLKELAGWSPTLTRIRPEHLAKHWLREELKLSFSPLANLQTALGLIPTVVEDYHTYAGQGAAAVASAILVDGAVSILTSKVGQIGGATLGSIVLTPVLGPLAPVVGYTIGGIAGSIVSDWLRQTPFQKMLRDTGREIIEVSSQAVVTAVQNSLNALATPVQ